MKPTQPPLEIGMLLYPGLTLLDLIGPQTVFSWFSNIHLVWKTTDLVLADTGIGIKPTSTFESCPRDLDILLVPGGFGQQAIMADGEVLAFLADRAPRQVCNLSLERIAPARRSRLAERIQSHFPLGVTRFSKYVRSRAD